jgi:hypothetical protein
MGEIQLGISSSQCGKFTDNRQSEDEFNQSSIQLEIALNVKAPIIAIKERIIKISLQPRFPSS